MVAAATAAGLIVLGVPVTALGLTGAFETTNPGPPPANAPQSNIKFATGQHSTVKNSTVKNSAAAPAADYHGYVALAGGFSIAEVDVATDTILSDSISADSPSGVAVTPDGSQIFVAETGQYHVIAVNAATGKETPIEVGPYPQDVAVSPDGSQVYATVTGGNTGPGGSDTVAVISTSTDAVVGDIKVGTAPRQVVFSPDGKRAYVTTESGISVIDTATGRITASIPDSGNPQGLAVSPDGSTLYVTNPGPGTVWAISTATDRVTARIAAGAEPYAVAVTPNGATAYVADMNSDSVAVISTASGRVTATVRAAASFTGLGNEKSFFIQQILSKLSTTRAFYFPRARYTVVTVPVMMTNARTTLAESRLIKRVPSHPPMRARRNMREYSRSNPRKIRAGRVKMTPAAMDWPALPVV